MTLKEKNTLTDEEKIDGRWWNGLVSATTLYGVAAIFAINYLFSHRNTSDSFLNMVMACFIIVVPGLLFFATLLFCCSEGQRNKWFYLAGVNFLLVIGGFVFVGISACG